MHLVSILAAGVRGAEHGSARLYQRGTTTRATWYENFDGSGANSSGAAITLDAYGAAVAYVNEHTDVVLYTSDGTLLRTVTHSVAAPPVEVISPSFLGTDYTTAAEGANKPTTLSAVLDLVITSFGTTNFKVLSGGSARLLKDVIAVLANVFIVTDTAYGATGDGSTDDRAAINAAITAANAAGGGYVIVPKGTYRLSAALTLSANVSLLGAGKGVTKLRIDHASNDLIDVTGGAGAPQRISGMTLEPMQNHSGNIIDCAADVRLTVDGCIVGDSTYTNGTLFNVADDTANRLFAEGVDCYTAGASAVVVASPNASAQCVFLRCYGLISSLVDVVVVFNALNKSLTECYFETASANAFTWFSQGASGACRLTGSDFQGLGGTGIALTHASAQVLESGCRITATTDLSFSASPTGENTQLSLRERTMDTQNGGATTDAVTVDTRTVRSAKITIAGTDNFTLNINGIMPKGHRFDLVIYNSTGSGSGTITLDSDASLSATWRSTPPTVSAGQVATATFISDGTRWFQMSAVSTGLTPG